MRKVSIVELLQPKDLGKVGQGGGEVVQGVDELHALGFDGHDLLAVLNEDRIDAAFMDLVEKEMYVVTLTVVRDADGPSVSAGKQPLSHLLHSIPSSQDDLLLLHLQEQSATVMGFLMQSAHTLCMTHRLGTCC